MNKRDKDDTTLVATVKMQAFSLTTIELYRAVPSTKTLCIQLDLLDRLATAMVFFFLR